MIDIRNVTKEFQTPSGLIRPLNNINLKINMGEFISLTGRSGSGKTTLLNILGGIIKPTSGNVIIDGLHLESMSEDSCAEYREKLTGFIFQDYFLENNFNVYSNIEIALMINGTPVPQRKDIIENVLNEVGLWDKREISVRKLSGGERQRVSIARALAKNSKYIFADEPCGNLDIENTKIVLQLLRKACDQSKTVIMVTHSQEDAAASDRIYKIQNGYIIE